MTTGVRMDRVRPAADPTPPAATALGRALAAQDGQGAPERRAASALSAALSGGVGRVLRPLSVPVRGVLVPALVRLLDHVEEQEVNLELAQWMAKIDSAGVTLAQLAATGGMSMTSERAVRTIARAVRDATDPDLPFGSVDDWTALDHQAIGIANNAYEDLLEELDPLGEGANPSDAEMIAIRAALKKKDRVSLSTFGARKLAAFMTRSGDPPESSETPT